LLDHAVEQRQERSRRAGDIGDQDRLVVQLELAPGEDLECLVERSQPAGEADEGIRHLEHAALAAVHAVGDDHFVQRGMRHLAAHEEIRDYPDDIASRGKRRIGECAHQPDPAAAINQPDTGPREPRAHRPGGFEEGRVVADARAAEHDDGPDTWHQFSLRGQPPDDDKRARMGGRAMGVWGLNARQR
jgi:hypothetical protein